MKLLSTLLGFSIGNHWKRDTQRLLRTIRTAIIVFLVAGASIVVTGVVASVYLILQMVHGT